MQCIGGVSEDMTMWPMLNLNATLAAAGWLCWPVLAANAPLHWLRFWAEVQSLPVFSAPPRRG
jgi:hypothetical protein